MKQGMKIKKPPFGKKARRHPPPPPLMESAPMPLQDVSAEPMYRRGGGVSDMDMDDTPRARKRADRKGKC